MVSQSHQRKKGNQTIQNKFIIFPINFDILQSEFKTLDWLPNWFRFNTGSMRKDYHDLNVKYVQ